MNILSLNIRGMGVQGKAKWVRDLRVQQEANCILLQETQCGDTSVFYIREFWGKGNFRAEVVDASGRSGGLITMWDPGLFSVLDGKKSDHCLLVRGSIKGSGEVTQIMNVYAPQKSVAKRLLWREIKFLIGSADGFWVVAGNFNPVRDSSEIRNSKFNASAAHDFNDFINNYDLYEFALKGRKFTFAAGC